VGSKEVPGVARCSRSCGREGGSGGGGAGVRQVVVVGGRTKEQVPGGGRIGCGHRVGQGSPAGGAGSGGSWRSLVVLLQWPTETGELESCLILPAPVEGVRGGNFRKEAGGVRGRCGRRGSWGRCPEKHAYV